MTEPASLPPFRVIAGALRTTTTRLVAEVVTPQNTAPDWTEFEWAVARAVCAMQGVSGLLAKRLRWRGPPEFREFLETQRERTVACELRIGELLAKLNAALGDAGIPFVPLKGSAIRELRLHEPGDRPQADIDLLIDPSDLTACRAPLEILGYKHFFSSRRHEVYTPAARAGMTHFGEHPDNALKIELHTVVAEALPVEPVDITASLFPAHRSNGANAYASLAALMRHMCLHAAGNMRANALRFIQVYEIGQLARRMARDDWHELLGDTADRIGAWWLFPPLALAVRHTPGSVPDDVLAEFRAVCPRRLREKIVHATIYELSWSNLRIPALPGVEWSRTVGENLRFLRSRLFPSPVALEELGWARAAQPQLAEVRWYDAPHFERVLRWLFTRPPRVQTITAISAALGTRA
jgi:hypothetical protein